MSTATAALRPRVASVFVVWLLTAVVLAVTAFVVMPFASVGYAMFSWGSPARWDSVSVFAFVIAVSVALDVLLIRLLWRRVTVTDPPRFTALVPPLTFWGLYALGIAWNRWAVADVPSVAALFLFVFSVAAGATVFFFARDARVVLIGIVALGVAVTAIVAHPDAALVAAQREAELEAEQSAAVDAAREAASTSAMDAYLDEGAFPAIVAIDGWKVTSLTLDERANVTLVTGPNDAHAAVKVYLPEAIDPAIADSATACAMIHRPGDAPVSADDPQPDWCVRNDLGWARADGTAATSLLGGRFTTVEADADAATLCAALVLLTRDQAEKVLLPMWQDGGFSITDPEL